MKGALLAAMAIATLAALLHTGQGSGASPTTVSCGQTLKTSTMLANDLTDCPKHGLIIGANNITVDLNGHTIDGTNAKGSAGITDGGCGASGQVCKGHSNVTIENGTITDFYSSGVGLAGAKADILRKLTIRDIGAGNRQGDICAGVFMMRSQAITVMNNVISNQVQGFQINGIDVYASPAARVERNRLERNAGDGISVFQSPQTRLVRNQLTGNKGEGIHVNSSSDSASVTGNIARGNGSAGIAVGASRNVRVLGNTASGNKEIGLLLFDLTDSLIQGNRATGNPDGIGLYGGQGGVAQYGGKHGTSHNQLVRNTATGNTRTGIWVRGDGGKDVAADNLLSGNVASHNGSAGGIALKGAATRNRLRGNTANSNAGHGIDARGAIDGGGNRAHGNRRPPQCVGVACR